MTCSPRSVSQCHHSPSAPDLTRRPPGWGRGTIARCRRGSTGRGRRSVAPGRNSCLRLVAVVDTCPRRNLHRKCVHDQCSIVAHNFVVASVHRRLVHRATGVFLYSAVSTPQDWICVATLTGTRVAYTDDNILALSSGIFIELYKNCKRFVSP